MNTTEQNRDQRIRDIYKNVQTPDSVKERINETLSEAFKGRQLQPVYS